MSGDELALCIDRFAGGQPVLVGPESDGAAFVALAAADVRAAGLRKLGELAGDMVLLAIDGPVAERIALDAPTPIDAAACRDGGWSLDDRALTMRLAAAPDTRRCDLNVPGHVLTLPVDHVARSAPPSAAVELARASGLSGAVALAAVHDRAGMPISVTAARSDARLRDLAIAPHEELRGRALERALERDAVECVLPTREGTFRAVAHASDDAGTITIALLHGDIARSTPVLVHEHLHCRVGDTFASTACRCRSSLDAAIAAILEAGAGVILYAKVPLDNPLACARGQGQLDPAAVIGLLARAGVDESVRV